MEKVVQICKNCSNRSDINPERILWLSEILPHNYQHYVCELVEKEQGVHTTMRLALATAESAQEWLESFQRSSMTTYRVERTIPISGEKVLFKTYFRCHHRTNPRTSTADLRAGSKNTNCTAGVSIVVRVSAFERDGKKRKCRSADSHMPSLPMIVKLKCTHNHPILAADALKHRDVSPEVKEKLLAMFRKSYSPAKALELHKYDLQVEHQDNYIYFSSDRAITPDLQYCYRLYYEEFKKEYGSSTGELAFTDLEQKINEGAFDANTVKVKKTTKNQTVIAIVTPLMRRVHKHIPYSGEMVFIDASGNMERQGCRVFLLLTHSCAGGLPLGILITTDETEETITEALSLYHSLLDESAYYGRGLNAGPEIIMTDDSVPERKALSVIYPNTNLLLCIFHVLQAFWRYLWQGKNCILLDHRPHLFSLLKKMMYMDTETELEAYFETLLQDNILARYEKVQEHVCNIYSRRFLWALCYRENILVRGNNTNNYAEAAMRILKDQVLERTKAYNILQLIHFMVTRLEGYYERRLIDICSNRLDRVVNSRFLSQTCPSIDPSTIICIPESEIFLVPSEEDHTKTYMVHTGLGVCTCKAGRTGAPCKHQHLVCKNFLVSSWNSIPTNDPAMKTLLFEVATGCSHIPRTWFESLRSSALFVAPNPSAEVIDTYQEDVMESRNITSGQDVNLPNLIDKENINSLHTPESNTVQSLPAYALDQDDDYLLQGLHNVVKIIEGKYTRNKDALAQPLGAFIKQATLILERTDAALASALHCFGRYSGAGAAFKRNSKMLSLKTIGVQPTAIARRRMLCGGIRKVGTGRPTRSAKNICPDKDMYLTSQRIPKRRVPAPHQISTCVSQNRSIGRNHSAK